MANRSTLCYRGAVDLTRFDIYAGRICLALLIPSLTIALGKVLIEICTYAAGIFSDAGRLISAMF